MKRVQARLRGHTRLGRVAGSAACCSDSSTQHGRDEPARRPGRRPRRPPRMQASIRCGAGEHVVVPDPQVPPSPMAPDDPALDSLLALTWAAAHTTTIRLATGIIILPQRNPLVLAKQVATLDVLSGGRAVLGVGAGYLEPEFRAWAPTSPSGARSPTSSSRRCRHCGMRSVLSTTASSPTSPGIDAHPRPLQRPIPIVAAGHSPPAYRRRWRVPTAGTATGSHRKAPPPLSPACATRRTRSTDQRRWATWRSA